MDKITLNFPFVVNDQQIKEITFDYSIFQTGDYLAAMARRKGGDISEMVNPANDYAMQFALGVGVILASNRDKGWTAEDFNRLVGSDIWQVTQVGLVFFGAKPAEQLRRAIRRYSERFHANRSDLLKMPMGAFWDEYQEAAEDDMEAQRAAQSKQQFNAFIAQRR